MLTLELHQTAQRLEHALEEGRVPASQTDMAARLLEGLQRPTQIAAFGMPKAGKTSLLNMILGHDAMPVLNGVAVVELSYGDTAAGRFESSNGETSQFQGVVTQGLMPEDTLQVVQELPLDALRGKQLVEINFTDLLSPQSELLEWATQNADIAVWCSPDFNEDEAAIWSAVPERLKDNGFLALTQADKLHMQGLLAQRVARFEQDHADEFLGLYPIATKQGAAARAEGEIVDQSLWKASGCKALTEALEALVVSGKQADADHADVLLARLNIPFPEAKATTAPAPTAPATDFNPMARAEAIETALSVLQTGADAMMAKSETIPEPAAILEHCAETSQALAALLMDSAPDDPALNALRDDAVECEQMIQLLQLERTDEAARDAVSVLLQIKKEMSQVAVG